MAASEEKRQVVNELHRAARKNFERRKTIMHGIADTYQIDLVEMIPFAQYNKNNKYILTVIDIFSKFAWAFPLKTKSAKCVTSAMSKLLESGNVPKNIHSDQGKEFYNAEFQQLMKRYCINHYSTYSIMKASIVERFNRTLKTKMWKYLNLHSSNKWLNILSSLIDEYNNTIHTTIKMKPKDVKKRHQKKLLQTVYKYDGLLKASKFKDGESVRISKFKHLFEKGYTPNFSSEIFTINKIQLTQPITYLLSDYQNNRIEGAFYEHELQKVKYPDVYLFEKIIRKKGKKMLVKWLGFDSSHNSWISLDDVN